MCIIYNEKCNNDLQADATLKLIGKIVALICSLIVPLIFHRRCLCILIPELIAIYVYALENFFGYVCFERENRNKKQSSSMGRAGLAYPTQPNLKYS